MNLGKREEDQVKHGAWLLTGLDDRVDDSLISKIGNTKARVYFNEKMVI